MAVKLGRDPRAESGMKRLHIEWSVETVRIADIDVELSMDRQARIGKKINEDWVLDYAQSMSEGAEFPMPILQKIKGGRYFIWSGNHRINSIKLLNELELAAYVVKVTDQRMQDILPRVVNTWEGHRESRDAVLEHARYVVERHGLSTEEVARMFGLRVDQLSVVMRTGNVAAKIAECGLKVDLPKSTLIKLAPIDNSNVLKATVKLIKEESLAGDKAYQLIEDVKRASTESTALAEVAKWRKIINDRKPPKVERNGSPPPMKRQNRGRFVDLLTRLEKFLDGIKTCTQLQLDDADVKIVAQAWDKVERKVNALMMEGRK